MQSHQKENVSLHDPCSTEKAARTMSRLELTALWNEKVSTKRIKELTRGPEEELSAQKRTVVDRKHKEDTVAERRS